MSATYAPAKAPAFLACSSIVRVVLITPPMAPAIPPTIAPIAVPITGTTVPIAAPSAAPPIDEPAIIPPDTKSLPTCVANGPITLRFSCMAVRLVFI